MQPKYHVPVETNACQSTPCLNDGACTAVGVDSYMCICQAGYHGALCETGKTNYITCT